MSLRGHIYIRARKGVVSATGVLRKPWPELAARVKALVGLDGDLLGVQANYQHTEFPQHKDDAQGDGFGACVATVNVRGVGR
eukprot:491437-Prymnesium_polylepis.1